MAESACIPLLKALADETRWRAVKELLVGALTVNELSDRLGASQYNISKHLRILRQAGIITTTKAGRFVTCTVAEEFRRKLFRNETVLDLGCCTFRFEKSPP